ncbi:hypothetical protein PRUPE_6G158500 [Prunus persica]|uniref:Reverse transcriptase domain-containing protein n=2 Tax=Prunus persica TaxID=3760 RepID=A0A251NR35_PRUPE|nr:hypothetical protein PRUPE_6G158500 [Prunus persica]
MDAKDDVPWVVMGDLNEVAWHFEKEGGAIWNPKRKRYLVDFMADNNLMDLGVIQLSVNKGKKNFKFEAKWLEDSDCEVIVKNSLNKELHGPYQKQWIGKLRNCKYALQNWRKGKVNNTRVQINHLISELDNIQVSRTTVSSDAHQRVIRASLSDLWKMEEIIGINAQKSTSSKQPVITQEMNANLTNPFTEDEILAASKQLGALKVPRLDGFPSIFYHKFWSTMKKEVIGTTKDMYIGLSNLQDLNQTHIALIPKVAAPDKANQFRPISLCNSSYKILSKILANRLKSILPLIISENQNEFLQERQIQDISFWLMRLSITSETKKKKRKREKKGKCFEAGLKMDMNKAFDRVEWDFLRSAMSKMGFADFWIRLVMGCITTVSFSVLLNDKKKLALSFIRERIQKKIMGWRESTLSIAGKETILKAVAKAIPTYSMMCFRFPTSLCKDINSDMAKFWWHNTQSNTGIHWKSWKHLCQSKQQGGLGFRDLAELNLALLGKQSWQILNNPNAYWVRVLKVRFFPSVEDFWQAKVGHRASWAWASLIARRDFLISKARKQIFSGNDTCIWNDRWLPLPHVGFIQATCQIPDTAPQLVCDIMDSHNRAWNLDDIRPFIDQNTLETIKKIPIGVTSSAYRFIWPWSSDGHYSVKSGYHYLHSETMSISTLPANSSHRVHPLVWKGIWKIKTLLKIKFFC